MTTDVLRLQGDYLIVTKNVSGRSAGGVLTLDVGGQQLTTTANTGTVYINGNLVVTGDTTFGNVSNVVVEDTKITDNLITLNAGENTSALLGGVTRGTSGLKISRGRLGLDQDQFAAFLEWNDTRSWQGTGAISNIQGIWEFRVGRTGRPQYSAIKVNAIRIDESSASTAGAGAGQGARLNIFGSDNPTAVISVSGTNNYESRVTDPDDIPNKAYVDNLLVTVQPEATKLKVGNSYATLKDLYNDGVTSEFFVVLDGDPAERLTVTTGTQVLRITPTVAQFQGVQFIGNEISPIGANENLLLNANGTGNIIFEAPILFETGAVPTPDLGQTGLYVAEPGGGGTGVFFVKKDLLGNETSDEFTSRKKALVYAIIFG